MVEMRRLLLAFAILLFSALFVHAEAIRQISWIISFPQRVGKQVMLMWEPVPGAVKYVVTRTGETGKSESWEISTNNVMDSNADPGETCTYKVVAKDAQGLVLGATPPGVVAGVKPLDPPKWGGSFQDAHRLMLSWQGDHRTVFYNLYRNLQGEKPKVIAAISSTSYVDEDVLPETTYEYFIRSVDKMGVESKDSGHISLHVRKWEEKKVEEKAETRLVEITKFLLAPEVKISEPTDIIVRNNILYFSDLGSRSVMVVAQDGKLIRRFATKPPEYQGVWGIPWGICADTFGRRFAVTFMQSPNVRVFDDTGAMLLDIPVTPPPELKPNQYLPSPPQPMDIAVEEQEGYWLTDYTYGQLIYLDIRGAEVGRVGKSRVEKDFGPFKSPTFLIVHPGTGYINVVDSMQGKVFRVFNDGQIAGFWGNEPQGETKLFLPKGIDVNDKGEILVIDGMVSSLNAYSMAGKLVATYATEDEREMPWPNGLVTVASNRENGELFVISKIENAIYRMKVGSVVKPQ